MLEDLLLQRLWLRRYADGPCLSNPGEYSYHHAMVLYRERAPSEKKRHPVHGWLHIESMESAPADDDPRWPTHCACGFAFTEEDPHQLYARQISRRTDTGEEITIEDAPVGAMWNCWWFADRREYKGPGSFVGLDGLSLSVRTPGGEWLIDGPAYNEEGQRTGGWTRNGTPPALTVTPSIRCLGGKGKPDKYHGWLTAGVLSPC